MPKLVPHIPTDDWVALRRALNKIASTKLGPAASPTFAGLTLTSLTQGSVIFTGTSGVLSQDNSNLFWDDTINRLGIGINSGFFPAAGITVSGEMDLIHTANEPDDHAFEIDVDAAGYGDVKAIDIDYITGDVTVGEDEAVILINIDEIGATGAADVFGLEVLATEGDAGIYGMKVGVVIGPIHQDSGTFENPTVATNDTISTNVPYMIDGLIANTTAIFLALNDYILIGDIAVFEEIEFIITTGSSGAGIKPKFEYSRAGSHLFTEFFPVDGTNGFRNTGVVAWDASALVNHGLNTDTTPDTYCIKITRQRINLTTTPVLGFTKTAATTEYIWDKDGNVNIKTLTISTIAAEGSDVDKFLVDSSDVIKYRTGTQVLSDIGAQTQGNVLDDLNNVGTVTGDSYFLVGTGAGTLAWETTTTVRTSLGLGTTNEPTFKALTLSDVSTVLNLISSSTAVYLSLQNSTEVNNYIGSNGTSLVFWTENTLQASLNSTALTLTGNIIMPNGGTIGQAAGPLLAFDDTNDFLEITGCDVVVGGTVAEGKFHVIGSAFTTVVCEREDNATNQKRAAFVLQHTTTEDMVDGFGGGMLFRIKDVTSAIGTVAAIYGYRDGADATGGLVIQTGTAGNDDSLVIDSVGSVFLPRGPLYIDEQAAARNDVTASGQIWVKNDAPNILMFTDDVGNDFTVDVTAV